jgi:hypothetical protein
LFKIFLSIREYLEKLPALAHSTASLSLPTDGSTPFCVAGAEAELEEAGEKQAKRGLLLIFFSIRFIYLINFHSSLFNRIDLIALNIALNLGFFIFLVLLLLPPDLAFRLAQLPTEQPSFGVAGEKTGDGIR